jgi:hypothetical protein
VAAGRARVIADASFDPLPLVDHINSDSSRVPARLRLFSKPQLSIQDRAELLLALISTALDTVAPAALPSVLGVQRWPTIGPVGYLQTDRTVDGTPVGLGSFIDVERYVQLAVTPNLEMTASDSMHVPRGRSLETQAEREEVVTIWLTRLLLEMGLEGFEDQLNGA